MFDRYYAKYNILIPVQSCSQLSLRFETGYPETFTYSFCFIILDEQIRQDNDPQKYQSVYK